MDVSQTQNAPGMELSQDPGHLATLFFKRPTHIRGVLEPVTTFDITLDNVPIFIGRAEDSTIKLSDRRVSSKHCIIRYNVGNRTLYLQNCSRNGTYLQRNKMPVEIEGSERPLSHGDEIAVVVHPSMDNPNDPEMTAPMIATITLFQKNDEVDLSESFVSEDFGWVKNGFLGGGNFSEVRLVMALDTREKFACKVIDKKRFFDFQKKQGSEISWSDEFNLLKDLEHPNIVQLDAVFDNEQKLYLVMEYVAGGDLLQYCIDHGPLPEYEAARILYQVLNAIKYIHEKKIAHRDIKPENILMSSREPCDLETVNAKLADFGLAKVQEAGKRLRTFCGTASYLAPEIAQRFRKFKRAGDNATAVMSTHMEDYNEAVDIWSLGAVLYIMIAQIEPFPSENGLFSQIEGGMYNMECNPFPYVSDACKDLIRGMLNIDAEKRLTVQQCLDHVWIRNVDKLTRRNSPVYTKIKESVNIPQATVNIEAGAMAAADELMAEY